MLVSSRPPFAEVALIAAKAADEEGHRYHGAEVRDLIGVTDYFVIATAANSRQVDAIIDEIEDKLREEASIKPTHREMSADGSWSLLITATSSCMCSCPRPAVLPPRAHGTTPVIDLAAEAGRF